MPGNLPDTIAAASRLIEARKLSPVEFVRGLLDRIEALDPMVNSFLTVTADQSLAQARAAESEIGKGHYRGPLHGIPFGLKDIYETAGIRTTGNSKVYANQVPRTSAAAADRLRQAGAILLGKLATHELAHGGPSFDLPWPPARNPWDLDHFTGGSSSGSAAAVAASMVLGSLGSDTGGSILGPASLCGIAGVKPSFGLVSRHGVMRASFSLDHCGPLAHTIEDCTLLLEAIVGYDSRDRSSAERTLPSFQDMARSDLKGVRIGVVRQFGDEEAAANEELRIATEDALRVMQELGARLHDVRLRAISEYHAVWSLIEGTETFAIQRPVLIERADDFGTAFLERTLFACLIQGADFLLAQQERARMIGQIDEVFGACDVLVGAGAGPAPRLSPGLAAWPNPNRTVPFALTGRPAVSVCIGFGKSNLPLGMHLVGRPFADSALLGIAHAYERATQWSHRRPVLAAGMQRARIDTTPSAGPVAKCDPAIVELCDRAARHAGLQLGERPFSVLCSTAPHALRMLEQVRTARGCPTEPANVFRFPGDSSG